MYRIKVYNIKYDKLQLNSWLLRMDKLMALLGYIDGLTSLYKTLTRTRTRSYAYKVFGGMTKHLL